MSEAIFDTDNFAILILKHLIRDARVFNMATRLKMTHEDLLANALTSNPLVSMIAESVFKINTPEVTYDLLWTHFNAVAEERGVYKQYVAEDIQRFLRDVYSDKLESDYIAENLEAFVRHRRIKKALTNSKSPEAIAAEIDKIQGDFRGYEVETKVTTLSPFAKIVQTNKRVGITTNIPLVDDVTGGLGKGECGLILGQSGAGKCISPNTPILMYNGEIKLAKDIVVGDVLMGDDSTPRNVLTTCVGTEEMFRVIPVKGDPWECNRSHILSMWRTDIKTYEDISVDEYLTFTKWRKDQNKLYRRGVEFANPTKPDIDPYILGVWLGDGGRTSPTITNSEPEIVSYFKQWMSDNGLSAKEYPKDNSITYRVKRIAGGNRRSIFQNKIEECMPADKSYKFIPQKYLTTSREDRLQLLAGLLDTDGYFYHGYYEIVTKYEKLRDGILYLARSLGFAAYSKEKIATIKGTDFEGLYHRITISGHLDQIPCKVPRKQAAPRRQVKNVLNVGFKLESLGEGVYCGFEIDGNRRFLLGDFTVTHNTSISTFLARNAAIGTHKTLYIAGEEPGANIANRFYAQQFQIDYTALHRGKALHDLELAFAEMSEDDRLKLANLEIADVRDMTPISIDGIKEVLEQKAAEGFIPDVVFFDQMDYMRSKRAMPKGSDKWRQYEQIAFECDELSQYKIMGEHEFALWIVHQASGDPVWEFNYNEVAGFKGIVKPFDLAIGLGREDRESPYVNLFSLKARHSQNFRLPMRANFSTMSFESAVGYKPKAVRDREERANKRGAKASNRKAAIPEE